MATIQASDVLPVRSRISWSAVLAGAATALAAYLVLITFGFAVGLSLEYRMTDRAMGIGAGIWVVASMLIALFIGGLVCSRCTAGENKVEAALGGIVVWGVMFILLAWLSSMALNTGMRMIFGTQGDLNVLSEERLREAGVPQDTINKLRGVSDGSPQTTHSQRVAAAWWTLTGMILSLAAAVAGGLVGAGPTLVLTSLRLRRGVVAEHITRETVTR